METKLCEAAWTSQCQNKDTKLKPLDTWSQKRAPGRGCGHYAGESPERPFVMSQKDTLEKKRKKKGNAWSFLHSATKPTDPKSDTQVAHYKDELPSGL